MRCAPSAGRAPRRTEQVSNNDQTAALLILIGGVILFVGLIAALIAIKRRADREPERHPMGDIPSLPEFIKRRHDNQ